MRNLLFASLIASFAGTAPASYAGQSTGTAHDYSFEAPDGSKIDLSDYAGKTVLVVNTASQCSFTKQYGPLQALYEKYKDRGFVVVGVPSNDFGGQEPGTDEQIADFTSREFQVDFPITAKTFVSGDNATPFYRWAANEVGTLGKPKWNFHKYLVGPDGRMVTWFSTMTEPDSDKLAAVTCSPWSPRL